jgi:HK97 family phage major capsid protein
MSKIAIPNKLPIQYRAAKVDKPEEGKRLSGDDPGRFSFALTSEEPVKRWFGDEVLMHGKENVRTQRLADGMVPLLFNHDPDKHIGKVDSFRLKDGVLRVEGPFGPSPLAQEKRADYDAGILNAASGGYRVHKMVRTATTDEDGDEQDDARCEVRDWEPFDASLVTVPADPTVGVGRNADTEFPVEIETVATRSASPAPVAEVISEPTAAQLKERTMAETAVTPNANELELARRTEIMAVATDKDFRKYVNIDEAQKAIAENTTADAFKDVVTRKIIAANDVSKVGTAGDATFSEGSRREQKGYSLINLLRSVVNQAKPGTFDGKHEAGYEREMSTAIAKRLGLATPGVFVPLNALTRALGTQAINSGSGQLAITSESAAVETITHPEVIELLRHRPRAIALGARTLGALQGVVRLPRQSGAGTWQWTTEGQSVTASDLTMDFVSVTPHRGTTQSAIDIELLASTSPDVEALMRADFNKIRNLALDYASINGNGSGSPTGILHTGSLATITPTGTALTSTGNPLTYLDLISFETTVAAADADAATSGWMFTPGVRGLLKGTPKFTNSTGTLISEPIWKEGSHDPSGLEEGPLGYKAGVTNQLPQNLSSGGASSCLHAAIFGDFSQMVFADWGAVEVVYDPYTQAGSGAIVLTMRSLHDIAIRHIAAFAATLKAAVN